MYFILLQVFGELASVLKQVEAACFVGVGMVLCEHDVGVVEYFDEDLCEFEIVVWGAVVDAQVEFVDGALCPVHNSVHLLMFI